MLIPYLGTIAYCGHPFVHYVQRSDSINNHQTLKTMQILDILGGIRSFYIEKGFYDEYKDALEFLYTRILLCSSFSRMCRIQNRKDRAMALKAGWKELVTTFPHWRSNRYLKKYRGKNALFMKCMNPVTYRLASVMLPLLVTIRRFKT
jgi:hypothetical protein